MNTHDAFLASLAESPADATVRGAFADWLKEQLLWGRPHLLSLVLGHPAADWPRLLYALCCEEEGDGARAEFIRAQLELARYGDYRCPKADQTLRGLPVRVEGASPCECRWCGLRRRKRGLFAVHGDEWCKATTAVLDPDGPTADVLLTCVPIDPDDAPNYRACAYVRRGFVAAVTLSAADFLTHAAALALAAPLEEVTLSTWPVFSRDLWPRIKFNLPEVGHHRRAAADLLTRPAP